MPLIVSLDRGAVKLDLGDFQSVVLAGNEVQAGDDDRVIARHIHNRWLSDQKEADSFMTLNIAGPLLVVVHEGPGGKLGPYYNFAMTDGILYVEQRVLGMWDNPHKDWYVKDASAHTNHLRIAFHATD